MGEMNAPLPLLASLLFSMIGPIDLLPLFAATTATAPPELRARTAMLAALLALGTLDIAVFVGAGVMQSLGTSRTALIIAAGIILTLTALRNIFGAAPAAKSSADGPTAARALMPLAIPGIVTPMGVAIVILFVSYFTEFIDKLVILGVIAGIMITSYADIALVHARDRSRAAADPRGHLRRASGGHGHRDDPVRHEAFKPVAGLMKSMSRRTLNRLRLLGDRVARVTPAASAHPAWRSRAQ